MVSDVLREAREGFRIECRVYDTMLGGINPCLASPGRYASHTHTRIRGYQKRICEESCGTRTLERQTHTGQSGLMSEN